MHRKTEKEQTEEWQFALVLNILNIRNVSGYEN